MLDPTPGQHRMTGGGMDCDLCRNEYFHCMHKAVTHGYQMYLVCYQQNWCLFFRAAQAIFLWFRIFELVGELRQSSVDSYELLNCTSNEVLFGDVINANALLQDVSWSAFQGVYTELR